MACYAGHLIATAEGFGQGFCFFGILIIFLDLIGSFYVFDSTLRNFVKNPKLPKQNLGSSWNTITLNGLRKL